jgi:hypothetical protein
MGMRLHVRVLFTIILGLGVSRLLSELTHLSPICLAQRRQSF